MSALERHPIDIARAAIGLGIVVALGALVHWSGLTDFERDVFQLVNDLPGWVGPPVIAIMQLGTLTAAAIAVAAALAFRKWWLALALTVGVGSAWFAAQYAKEIVNRGRPLDFLSDVIVRGSPVRGYGYPSAHCTVAAALVTIASPYLPREMRRAGWAAVFVVAFARMYVGAHFPLDVIGGIALGWSIGALTNLVVGTPCHELADRAVQRALVLAHYNATELTRVADDGHDEVPFIATIDDGPAVFVKALDGERRHADALATAGRYLAYRHVEDEHMFASARERIEHEALAASLATQAGVRAAHPLAVASARRGPSVLVLERIDGHVVGEAGDTVLDDETIAELWKQVQCMRGIRMAHRHLSLDNVMLDGQGRPWLVEFADADVDASDRALAKDVAELMASLALVVGPERAVDPAVAVLGKAAVADALPLLQPLALATCTRRALRDHDGLLKQVRDHAADAVDVEHPKLEPLMRVRPHDILTLACVLVATFFLLPQVGDLSNTVSAARDADVAWLVVAAAFAATTFAAAALSLTGAVLVPLAYGRTFVTQLASSFSNKITPAGLGGMGVNVRYLQYNGVSRGDALGAVALNGSVGAVVHFVAFLVSALVLRRTGLPPVHLPSGWILLVATVVILAALGIALETSFGRKHILLPTKRTARDLVEVVRRPAKAAQMFIGGVLVLASYVVVLGLTMTAFRAHASWSDVTAVYVGGSAVASAAPTPGKVGAVEAALIAGFAALGIASGPAVAGVLSFRLLTFWLPIIPGYLAFRSLAKRELL